MSAGDTTFSENDIRPHDLIAGQQKAIENDIAYLLSREKEFVKVDCPACGGTSSEAPFEKNGFHYATCTSCGTMYMNPRPSAGLIEDFLKRSENYAYWDTHIFPVSEQVRRQKIFVPRVDRVLELVKKYDVATDALLEVGAGHGTFCIEMNSRNVFKRVVAVEPSPDLARTVREKGVEVIESVIEKADPGVHGTFDVIVNFEVIEHLFSPREFLESCQKLLKPGGLFVVTCPNGKGFDFLVLGKETVAIDHEHINYFNPESLSNLLSECGFEVVESMTPGVLDADMVRNRVLEGKCDLSGQPFLKRILIDEWDTHGAAFQKYIQESGMSSNMWLIATKR